jgi:hypothetical protein
MPVTGIALLLLYLLLLLLLLLLLYLQWMCYSASSYGMKFNLSLWRRNIWRLFCTCSLVTWTYFTFSVTIFILSSSSIPGKINFIFFLGDRMQGGDKIITCCCQATLPLAAFRSHPPLQMQRGGKERHSFCCFEHQYIHKAFVRLHNAELVLTQKCDDIFIPIRIGSGGNTHLSTPVIVCADTLGYRGTELSLILWCTEANLVNVEWL